MRNNHAFLHRTHALAGLLALALGCLSLSAHAVNKGNIGRASYSTNGRTGTVAPPTNSGGSTIPVSPNIGGWTQAGNYGVPPGATGATVGHVINGEAVVGGSAQKYPFQATYTLTKADWAVGALSAAASIGCVFATGGLASIACLTLPTALPYLYDWITRSGGRVNPQTGALERIDPTVCTVAPCYSYRYWTQLPWRRDMTTACEDSRVYVASQNPAAYVWRAQLSGTSCQLYYKPNVSGTEQLIRQDVVSTQPRAVDSATWYPSSMDDILPYMKNVVPDNRVWGEALDKGVDFTMPNPVVTGPTVIQGPETVKQNADGTKEVSKTTYNFTTNGNQITNTTNVTTTNTYNSSNTQTGTSTTTVTPTASTATPQEPEDACTKHPEALGCQKIDFDTPDGQIPRESKDVTFQAENVLGGGSCPADVYSSVTSLGQTLKVWDWQATCNYFLPIRFILMALAAFSAVLIIMPGGGKSV